MRGSWHVCPFPQIQPYLCPFLICFIYTCTSDLTYWHSLCYLFISSFALLLRQLRQLMFCVIIKAEPCLCSRDEDEGLVSREGIWNECCLNSVSIAFLFFRFFFRYWLIRLEIQFAKWQQELFTCYWNWVRTSHIALDSDFHVYLQKYRPTHYVQKPIE